MTLWGVVLAGGASRRMGGVDKTALRIGNETFLQRAVRRLAPQVDRVVVNGPAPLRDGPAWQGPENREWLQRFGATEIVEDAVAGRAGPLAGLLAVMEKAGSGDRIVTVAVDTPFFPDNLVERLHGDGTAFAASQERVHPVFGFWSANLAACLRAALERDERKILAFADRHGYRTVPFDHSKGDPFFNVNTPDDLSTALAMAP